MAWVLLFGDGGAALLVSNNMISYEHEIKMINYQGC
jgi:hypothetical protein